MPVMHCLGCYEPLPNREFHPVCSKKVFGTTDPPEFPYALHEMTKLADQVVRSSVSVPGVQAKLSVDVEATRGAGKKKRLTIVGMWGRYVLKPPTEEYPALPEIEDLTMHIAAALKIRTVPHTLIRIKSGELAYITRRVDRANGEKLHMEDMCQLTEKLTEDKYKGSMEQIGKILHRFSGNRGFDMLEFLRLALVSFLTENADMHLKNFSLLTGKDGSIALAPAYDLVATKLVLPEDKEEMALTINGKKGNFRENDFHALARSLNVSDTVYENSMREFKNLFPQALAFIDKSFLLGPAKTSYKALLKERGERLHLFSIL
jgi:serine/threonine-protein kinase HipA